MRKKLLLPFALITLLVIGNVVYAQDKDSLKVDIGKYLPEGEVKVEILEMQTAYDYKDLQAKLQQAITENQEWFSEYSKTFIPGEEVPYHPNFGLTEKEYYRLIRGEDKEKLMPGDSGKITIAAIDDGSYKITSLTKNVDVIDKLRLHMKDNYVETPDYKLDQYKAVKADKEKMKLTGPWNGHQWKYEENDSLEVTFTLGTTVGPEKRTIMMYTEEVLVEGEKGYKTYFGLVAWPPEQKETEGQDDKKDEE